MIRHARWLAFLGDAAYAAALSLNTWINRARRRLGFGDWSLSACLKGMVKGAVAFVDRFETALAEEARRRGCDGMVRGHIHKAGRRVIDGIEYLNDGDWVERGAALVEHTDGRLEIIDWAALRSWSMLERAPGEAPGPLARLPERAAA